MASKSTGKIWLRLKPECPWQAYRQYQIILPYDITHEWQEFLWQDIEHNTMAQPYIEVSFEKPQEVK